MVDQAIRNEAFAPEMLTIAEVARRLHAHPNSVRRWANQGLLPCYRFGVRGDRRFRADEVDQFVRTPTRYYPNGENGHDRHNGDSGLYYRNGDNGK